MYENVTYEKILMRMMGRVPDNLDKREGSVIYTALAPAAAEMQLMYIEFDTIMRETFADTASREYLVRRAAERGIKPNPASKAVRMAVTTPDTVEISVGERFGIGLVNYSVTEKISGGQYKVECETPGIIGNSQFGQLIPVGNIPGLETAMLTEVLIPGENEMETEVLRKLYFSSFDEQSFAGNRKDYRDKANGIAGVGATKTIRAWNGAGTVKLMILDSDFDRASDMLIEKVQQTIDPAMDGDGDGLAPIDHIVTIDTAVEVTVQVESSIVFDNGYSFSALQDQIGNEVRAYLLELRKSWEEQRCTVRISQIEARLLAMQGVVDIGSTRINGSNSNLELTEYEIPVFGGVFVD